ncbi:unnamed protein product [Linum tenue]|uniref:Expansin-like EG45 domain-containing protein n=1 Tax=Linum tenue TaxID=586396 RepID=A0AAV0IAE5_9ROSI|nr:unnamed protein product [Linum tenue]
MGVMIKSLALATVLLVVAFVPSPASAIAGTATFYTTYVPSACYGLEDQGVMIAAVSDPLWNNGAACGRMYNVRCTDPRNCKVRNACKTTTAAIIVTVVDYCKACTGDLNLSRGAFSRIANPDAGKVRVAYDP